MDSSYLIPLITGVVGFLSSYIILMITLKGKIGLKLLDKKIDDIFKFIDSAGVKELISFFEKVDANELQKDLKNLPRLEKYFIEQKEKFETVNRLITARFFNPVTGKIHSNIESNEKFIKRLKQYESSKKYLMRYFTELEIVQEILRDTNAIFVESGSTLAYCMLGIIENIRSFREKPLVVCTNNISIYMILLFEEFFNPVLLPGNPNNQYGATFADLKESVIDQEFIKEFLSEHKIEALFTTSSVLDISYGPHVSSARNYYIKKILNDYANKNDLTNIHVIVSEKINQDVRDKKINPECKLIFDPKATNNVLNHEDVLNNVRRGWEKHLSLNNNFIITGSENFMFCNSAVKSFTEENSELHHHILNFGNGGIAKISSNRIETR